MLGPRCWIVGVFNASFRFDGFIVVESVNVVPEDDFWPREMEEGFAEGKVERAEAVGRRGSSTETMERSSPFH